MIKIRLSLPCPFIVGDATASLKFEPLAVVQSRKKSVASSGKCLPLRL